MKIHRIAFENFRSFSEKNELKDMKPVSVFVGSNNTGKSNVIEFLVFLREMTRGGWSRPHNEIIFDNNSGNIKLELELELSEDDRRKIFSFIPKVSHFFINVDYEKDNIFKYLKYTCEISKQRCLDERLHITDQNKKYVPIAHHLWTASTNSVERNVADLETHILNVRGLENLSPMPLSIKSQEISNNFGFFIPISNLTVAVYKIIYMIIEFLQKIRVFGVYRKANVKVGGGEQQTMDTTGSNVVGVMNTILGTDTDEYGRIMAIYKEIVGGIKTVNVPPVGGEYTIRIKEDGLNSQIDFANMSSGLHQALILVFAIEKAGQGETICIEEPEIHLHASAQKRLFRYMRTQSVKNQIFITTHSSIFASIDEDIGTYLITKSHGRSNIVLIDDESSLRLIKQQLGIRNSDIFGSDFIIFIEGDSEEYAFPIVAKALGYGNIGTEAGKKIRLVNMYGNGIVPKLGQFLNHLKASDTEIFIIADGDKKVHSSIEGFVREGLLKDVRTKVWQKEFEDTFESKRIIDSMKKLSIKNGFTFDMSVEHLDAERTRIKVAEILQKYLHENHQPDLDKPELAQQLAQDITEELKSGTSRTETEFETEIKRIMAVIKSIDDQNIGYQTRD